MPLRTPSVFLLSCLVFLVIVVSIEALSANEPTRYFYQLLDKSKSDRSDVMISSEVFINVANDQSLNPGLELEENRKELEILDERTLIKLHGAFMVFAWMGTTTIGVIIAR